MQRVSWWKAYAECGETMQLLHKNAWHLHIPYESRIPTGATPVFLLLDYKVSSAPTEKKSELTWLDLEM